MKPIKIMVESFKCPYCKRVFTSENNCIEHIKNYCLKNKSLNWYWYVVEKSYRNGSNLYAFQTAILDEKWENYDLLEYIGEHTNGGHSYGYRIENLRKCKSKPYPNKNKNETFEYLVLPDELKNET